MNKYKYLTIFCLGLNALPSAFAATKIQDLKLDCSAHYKVLSSKAYADIPEYPNRLGPQYGTKEKIELLKLVGYDCKRLKADYGLDFRVGEKLNYGISTFDFQTAQEKAQKREGKIFQIEAQQHFGYVNENAELPLFPLLHKESLSLLGKQEVADSAKLYGSKEMTQLTAQEKQNILQILMKELHFGKRLQNFYSPQWVAQYVDLFLQLVPKSREQQELYLSKLLQLFSVGSEISGSFLSAEAEVKIGKHINLLLNQLGGTQWSHKVEVWKRNPLLFDDQIIAWAFLQNNQTIPRLSEKEMGEVVNFYANFAHELGDLEEFGHFSMKLRQLQTAANDILRHKKHFPLTDSDIQKLENVTNL